MIKKFISINHRISKILYELSITHDFYLFYRFYFDVAKLRIIFKCYKYFLLKSIKIKKNFSFENLIY